jgi:beta-lactamase class D
MIFTMLAQPRLASMNPILLVGNIFKITNSIVSFDSVTVIDFHTFWAWTEKSRTD